MDKFILISGTILAISSIIMGFMVIYLVRTVLLV
jgi:hypothetical protein